MMSYSKHCLLLYSDAKNVARGLSLLLSELLPSSPELADSLPLLNDLCQFMSALLKSPIQGGSASVDIAFDFMCKLFQQYGKFLETNFAASSEIELVRIVRSLMLNVVETVQEYLGNIWTKPSEQDNGQVAFESKPMPTQKVTLKSSDSLGGMLDVLTQGLKFCPKFLIHLPSPGSGLSRDNNTSHDALLRRAVDAAAALLEEYFDVDGLRSAIFFLKTLVSEKCAFYIPCRHLLLANTNLPLPLL